VRPLQPVLLSRIRSSLPRFRPRGRKTSIAGAWEEDGANTRALAEASIPWSLRWGHLLYGYMSSVISPTRIQWFFNFEAWSWSEPR
jgi:hypothetical protein